MSGMRGDQGASGGERLFGTLKSIKGFGYLNRRTSGPSTCKPNVSLDGTARGAGGESGKHGREERDSTTQGISFGVWGGGVTRTRWRNDQGHTQRKKKGQ